MDNSEQQASVAQSVIGQLAQAQVGQTTVKVGLDTFHKQLEGHVASLEGMEKLMTEKADRLFGPLPINAVNLGAKPTDSEPTIIGLLNKLNYTINRLRNQINRL